MLGPSDVRKAAGTLVSVVGTEGARTVASLLETRLGTGSGSEASSQGAETQYEEILQERFGHLNPELHDLCETSHPFDVVHSA